MVQHKLEALDPRSSVNLFHRAADRAQRRLNDNEDAQKRSQRQQDGSEIRSVELERLLAEGLTLTERRNGLEAFRDQAAEQYQRHVGLAWLPRAGSKATRAKLTAAMIDRRDYLAAKHRTETLRLLPPGPKIVFTGGAACDDHGRIWDALDKVFAKHPDMVLLHGGTPTGAERIAACWAEARKVTQIAFKPDWTRHAKAAPFKRNDKMLEVLPIGVLAFPGTGINANLADKAKMWAKTSSEGRDSDLSVKLDDPGFTAPIFANLFDDEGGETYTLIWSRPRKPSAD